MQKNNEYMEIFVDGLVEVASESNIKMTKKKAEMISVQAKIQFLNKKYVLQTLDALRGMMLKPSDLSSDAIRKLYFDIRDAEETKKTTNVTTQDHGPGQPNTKSPAAKEFFFLFRYMNSHEYKQQSPDFRKILVRYVETTPKDINLTTEDELYNYVFGAMQKGNTLFKATA